MYIGFFRKFSEISCDVQISYWLGFSDRSVNTKCSDEPCQRLEIHKVFGRLTFGFESELEGQIDEYVRRVSVQWKASPTLSICHWWVPQNLSRSHQRMVRQIRPVAVRIFLVICKIWELFIYRKSSRSLEGSDLLDFDWLVKCLHATIWLASDKSYRQREIKWLALAYVCTHASWETFGWGS